MRKGRIRRQFVHAEGELMLAAMVDILVNLLIFLLTLYGAGPEGLESGGDLELPISTLTSEQPQRVSVTVGPRGVLVEGRPVVSLTGEAAEARLPEDVVDQGHVRPLAVALSELLPPEATGDAVGPEVVLQVDRRLPWDVVGPVVRTASDAGFSRVRFLVQTDEAGR